jgi:hypothetical protein
MNDLKGLRLKPADIHSAKWDEVVLCAATNVVVGTILRAVGVQGPRLLVDRAAALTPAEGGYSLPVLYAAKTSILGNSGPMIVTRYGVITTAVDPAANLGDPVYLSGTPGELSIEPTGQYRVVGTVLEAGDEGKVLFDGGISAPSYINGTVVVAGAASVQVPIADLGANLTGCIAGACCQTVDGTVHVIAVEIGGGGPDLTIHFSAAFTGTVGYWVFLQGVPPFAP